MSQQETEQGEYLSICDIWKDNVHKVITKALFQTPLYFQAYTQVHTEFLQAIDNVLGTCYLWQKQYFDKLGIDKQTINSYAELQDNMTNYVLKLMGTYASAQKYHSDLMVESLRASNGYARQYLDMYAAAVSVWNARFSGNFMPFAATNKD